MAHEIRTVQYPGLSIEQTERKRNREKLRVANWRKRNPEKYKEQYLRYQRANRDKILARNKEYRDKNIEHVKHLRTANRLRVVHGLSREKYQEMLDRQQGLCAICRMKPEGKRKKLVVDHNHATGEIRGMLCDRCNLGLGSFMDNRNLLINAAKYLNGGDLSLTT